MKTNWDVTPSEAIEVQQFLRKRVRLEPLSRKAQTVAGADISFNRYSDVMYAGFVVLELPSLRVVATSHAVVVSRFPYIPGLLTFREAPPLLEAWRQLEVRPDVVMFDG